MACLRGDRTCIGTLGDFLRSGREPCPNGAGRRRGGLSHKDNGNLRVFTISHHKQSKSMFKWSYLSQKSRHDIYRDHDYARARNPTERGVSPRQRHFSSGRT